MLLNVSTIYLTFLQLNNIIYITSPYLYRDQINEKITDYQNNNIQVHNKCKNI